MRNIYVIISVLLFSLAACQEKEIPGYSIERDGLQFDYGTNEMRVTVDFMQEYRIDTIWYSGVPGEGSYYTLRWYTGDSLLKKKIQLNLSMMGHAVDYDREFRLKAVVAEGTDEVAKTFLEFEPSYVFRAGQLKNTVEVYVLNPGASVNYTIGIVLDTENSDPSLELGAMEKNEYQVLLSNRYPQPSQWDASVVGEFSEDKYAFMVTILGKLYDQYADWSTDLATLSEALNKYNASHPGEEKDFTFPEPPAPVWWGTFEYIIGEYSMAKNQFMQEALGDDYNNFGYWDIKDPEGMNQRLRDAYDEYNAEHPDDPLPFEQFPVI